MGRKNLKCVTYYVVYKHNIDKDNIYAEILTKYFQNCFKGDTFQRAYEEVDRFWGGLRLTLSSLKKFAQSTKQQTDINFQRLYSIKKPVSLLM